MEDPSTVWTSVSILWYDGVMRSLEIFSGVSLWYTPGFHPVPINWAVVRDPEGWLRTEAFFCTDLKASAEQILRQFILRWNVEVTFEELRAHLGFETQRQQSDKAIERTTPALFGLFSLVTLMAIEIVKDGSVSVLSCAWYRKPEAAFSDVIALVRRHIWSFNYTNPDKKGEFTDFKEELFQTMLQQLCYGI